MSESDISILVVDDLPENRRLYHAILSELGCSVVEAASGEEALALCQRDCEEGGVRDHAMILLDVHMPGLDGFETARRIRAIPCNAHTPIVFASAVYTREADAYAGYGIGAVDYLLAPVVPDILRAKARVFIELNRMRREIEAHAAALEDLNRQIELAYRELEAFSSAAAHDLQAPLRRVALMAESILEEDGSLSEEDRRAFLRRIHANARNAHALVDDLLTLSRVTRSPVQRSACDLSALAGEIARGLADSEPQRQAEVNIAAGLRAQADPGLLRVVLANLLDNAWKYSAAAERPRIEFGRAANGAYFVRDNGAGFDADQAGGRLAQPFQRFHNHEAYPGTGIGLATVQRILHKHGGRLWAESAPGQGATFYFTLENHRG